MARFFRSPIILQNLLQNSGKTLFSPHRRFSLMTMKPYDFVEHLKENGLRRCYVVYDGDNMVPVCSEKLLLHDLHEFCEHNRHNYLKHEGVFLEIGKRTNTLLGTFIWRTNRGQACGGIRLWEYDTVADFINDGLRLAYGMGLKSALAGLWAGGGKGVIASPGNEKISDESFRKNLFLDYGDFLSSLNGCYVAAEDAGVGVSDIDTVFENTRFTTCISAEKGGSGNPSIATGKGVVCAMESALDFLQLGAIEGKSIVSQGVGNVARVIIDSLLDKNVEKIYATDCNEQQLDFAEKLFASKNGGRLQLEHVSKGENDTIAVPCDILSPNAMGNILTEKTIPSIKAKVVCGAANNQLGKPSDNKLMMDMGITYVVDFLCNRMGIVNCANENYGRLDNDPALTQHFSKEWKDSIWNAVQDVQRAVNEKGLTQVEAAAEIAERKSLEYHPIWPKRSKKIIEDLVSSEWCKKISQ